MYKITVIVPVYNSETYLRDSLESIVHQTMKLDDIEVIMVDDCSTDKSTEIMDEYTNKYKNFVSIKMNKNHEVAGTARNEGMKKATGKYLMFIDSDDLYVENACEIMYNAIEQKNADFIIGNYVNMDYDGNKWEHPIFDQEKYQDFKLSITDYDKSFFILNSAVWNKIFRRDFVEKNNIQFLEGVPAEDAYFTNSCFMKAENVYYISTPMYYYRQRSTNNSTQSVSFHCSRDYFDKINRAYRAIYESFKSNGHIRFYRYTYAKNMSYMLYKFIDSTLMTDEERVQVLKDMQWFYKLSVTLKVPAAQKCQTMIINKILEEDYEEAVNYCKIVADIRTFLPKEIRENLARPDAKMYHEVGKYNEEY